MSPSDPDEIAKQAREHAWNWFALHATQRMQAFNFFMVATASFWPHTPPSSRSIRPSPLSLLPSERSFPYGSIGSTLELASSSMLEGERSRLHRRVLPTSQVTLTSRSSMPRSSLLPVAPLTAA